jgi:hypothetical protein
MHEVRAVSDEAEKAREATNQIIACVSSLCLAATT